MSASKNVSVNQQFKAYMERLERAATESSGPIADNSAAKLDMLLDMGRTERFQWYCANVLGSDVTKPRRERKDKRADAAYAIAEAVHGPSIKDIDRDAAVSLLETLADALGVTVFGGTVVKDTPDITQELKRTIAERKASKTSKTRKASTKSSKASKKADVDGTNRWRKTTLAKLGYKNKVGQQFKHKGTRWLIVDADREFAYAVKAS